MRNLFFVLLALLISCGSQDKKNTNTSEGTSNEKVATNKQLNITILWDLSDRIDPNTHPANPQHYERDLEVIKTFAELFKNDMSSKGTYLAKGKIKVIFNPIPDDTNIQQYAQNLNIDLESKSVPEKKPIYDNVLEQFAENSRKICESAIAKKDWPGSDIWRFFKNDVKDLCVSDNSDYRNILVILTDGYIYHENSKDKIEDKYAYILPDLFDKYKLRNNPEWESVVKEKEFGLISKRDDLQDLEVLVLEVTPSDKHKNDEDIIKKVLSNWFDEMNVGKYSIYNTDLPNSTLQRIKSFLGQ